MNIFILDKDIKKCAQYHCNLHCLKMIIEYAQLLCSAHHILDNSKNENLYKLTHKNHPCAIWTRESDSNYEFLYNLFCELSNEYTFRYYRVHKTFLKLKEDLSRKPENIKVGELTEFPKCMPDEYKEDCPIESYRKLYILEKSEKFKLSWKNREIPEWFVI